jgi:hypothetical protein
MEERERMLAQDVHSFPGHGGLARILTEAFRIDLSRSTFGRVAETSAVQ